jgi:leucine dehydrogenase
VPALRCELVVGGANNQLASPAIGDLLHRNGILYVPDYVANAGGLISVTQEYVQSGRPTVAQLERAVARVGTTAAKVVAKSIATGRPTHRVADRLARDRVRRFS